VNAVELSGVEVELGGRLVLGPFDLALPERSWTLLVGPSGSGKTTLLRAVAGLVAPRAGTIRLSAELASEGPRLLIPPGRRALGFVFQGAGAGLWPHLSVQATLEFVLSCRKLARAERPQRVREMLALVGLTGLERRRPGELSGGEAQRLALARALVVRPHVLLLDEPLGALDAPLRSTLAEHINGLFQRFELSILHVTHDPGEARRFASRTVRIEQGRLVADEEARP
jgi:iron(III) transport system ATP-binding protein